MKIIQIHWCNPLVQKAPEGKEQNWIPTGSGKNFEAMLRFYGPEEALFKKTWKLPDIEEVNEY